MTPSGLDRYTAAILHRRWLVAVLATVIMLAVTGGARFIGVTNDYRSLFDEDNPQLAALDALENTYTVSKTALIAVAAARRFGRGRVDIHPRDARRDRRADRGGVARAPLHPGRLAHQLLPQRGVRRRPDRRAARRGRCVARRCRSRESRGHRAERRRHRRAPGVPRRARGRGGDQLHPARERGRRDGRDHRLPRRHAGRGPSEPPGPRLPPHRRHRHGPRLRRHHAGRDADPRAAGVRHHRGRRRGPSAFGARHPRPRGHAGVRRQHHPRVRRLDRHRVQSRQFRRADHRHDGRRRPFGPHRRGGTGEHGAWPGQTRSRRRIASRQRVAGVSHHRHHGDRVPEPECFGCAAVSRSRQPGGVRRAVRLRVLHDPAAGAALDAAAPRASAPAPQGPASSTGSATSWSHAARTCSGSPAL